MLGCNIVGTVFGCREVLLFGIAANNFMECQMVLFVHSNLFFVMRMVDQVYRCGSDELSRTYFKNPMCDVLSCGEAVGIFVVVPKCSCKIY